MLTVLNILLPSIIGWSFVINDTKAHEWSDQIALGATLLLQITSCVVLTVAICRIKKCVKKSAGISINLGTFFLHVGSYYLYLLAFILYYAE